MEAWNKGKRVGQKKAFKLEDIWRIRIRLELEERLFELALFNLAIDCKLRSCDLRNLKAQDVSRSGCVMSRTIVKQQEDPARSALRDHTQDSANFVTMDHSKLVVTNRLSVSWSTQRRAAHLVPLLHHHG